MKKLTFVDLYNNFKIFQPALEHSPSVHLSSHLSLIVIIIKMPGDVNKVDLSYNGLVDIPRLMLEQMTNSLKSLWLSGNVFIFLGYYNNLGDDTFPILTLTELHLDNCQIRSIHERYINN